MPPPELSGDESSLLDAYQAAGGAVTSDEFIRALREHCEQPLSMFARRIVARELVTFSWRCDILIPMFQFDPETGSSRADVMILIAELAPAFDDQEVAWWFVRANDWLAGASPLASLSDDFGSVLHAARTDRFIALG